MDFYKLVKTINTLSEAAPAPAEQTPSANTPQAQAAAKALQTGILKLKQQYPDLDTAFDAGLIDEIRPDGTVVITPAATTGRIASILALGGGANFKVIKGPEPGSVPTTSRVSDTAKSENPWVRNQTNTDIPGFKFNEDSMASAAQQQSANTPQARAAAKALQTGILKLKQQYPSLDTAFDTGVIEEIRPDGTIVISPGNSTGRITKLLALGGGANFKVIQGSYNSTNRVSNPANIQNPWATNEDSMDSAAHHESGAKFGGYWKGTQKSPPKPGQGVGGMEESIEEQIAREWKHFNEYGAVDQGGTGSSGKANRGNGYYTYDVVSKHADDEDDKDEEQVTEQGANNPPQGAGPGTSQVDQQQTAQELQTAQNNINKLKTAGVNIPVSPSQAAQSAVKTVNDPKANAATGMGMDQASKKTAGGLGQEFEKTIAKANPGQLSQIANVMKQVKTGQQ